MLLSYKRFFNRCSGDYGYSERLSIVPDTIMLFIIGLEI